MEVLASFAVWAAAFVAFVAGMAVQSFVHALQNLRKTKETIPALRKTKRDARFTAGRRLFYAMVVATVITVVIARLH
jgi:hypothetical protein